VDRVLHPAFPDCPGHALWQRDFTGSSGLFSVVLRPVSRAALAACLDGMALFAMGFSWGGYESLIVPSPVHRTLTPLPEGRLVRLHAGLDDPDDLIADLEAGLDRMNATTQGEDG